MRISDWSSDVCSSDLISVGDMPVGVLLDEAIIVPAHDNNLRRQRENSLYPCIIGFGRRGTAVRIDLDDGIGDEVLRSRRSIRSEEHTAELQSLMRISYAVFCLNKKNATHERHITTRASVALLSNAKSQYTKQH